MIHLKFAIDLHSDYHVSAGQRAGLGVDSALLRDHDDAPVLRGTTLAGLLRDGLSDLQSLLQQSGLPMSRPIDSDTFCRLFGEPKRRKRWAISSARPLNPAEGSPNLRWGSRDTARVRINPRTRRAQPQQLFFQEEGDARLKFLFEVTCQAATGENVADAALMVAASRMVRHLGSARRRGRGRCTISLVEATGLEVRENGEPWDTEAALNLFRDLWLTPGNSVTVEAPGHLEAASISRQGTYRRFRIIVQLLEPVLVAQRLQAANTIETLPVIPGSTVLGALASRAAERLGLQGVVQPPDEFIELFLRGGLQVSTLLPARNRNDAQLQPAVPAPRNLYQCENFPFYSSQPTVEYHPVHNGLAQTLPDACPNCGSKLKPVGEFLPLGSARDQLQPLRREEMHIEINRQTGRVREGQLYEYITLEAGQWYVGEIRCDDGTGIWERLADLTDLTADLRLTLRLGKAARRGHGLVHCMVQELDEEAPAFVLAPFSERVTLADNVLDLSLLLLTDTIVVDTWNRYYVGFDRVWLADVLSCEAVDVSPDMVEIVNNRLFTASREVDAFHTYRRMPRWRDKAIVAGSAVALRLNLNEEADMDALLDHLFRLEQEGIGLRRHEGFGRIAWNHPLLLERDVARERIGLTAVHDLLYPDVGEENALAREAEFRSNYDMGSWRDRLDEENWTARITPRTMDDYEAVARLLFLHKHSSPQEVKTWLATTESGEPQHLFKIKNLWQGEQKGLASGKEPRLSSTDMVFLNELITELETRFADFWTAGIEILIERMAEEIERVRHGSG